MKRKRLIWALLLAAIVIVSLIQPRPKQPLPYSKVYEPDSSWPLAATVAWRAGPDVIRTAGENARPAAAFVWLDSGLKVYDRDGGLISADLDAYVRATAPTMIPAFYIRDAAAAEGLKKYLDQGLLQDCFVVSGPENRDLVRDVADLTHVRGMLDYTAVEDPDRAALIKMISDVNSAHGKVVILSHRAATRENVRLLQSLMATVWVQCPPDIRSLTTCCAMGVNGIVTDDYTAAFRVLGLFRDDAPSLLRVPMIIGHRGMPSMYVENTLPSALGAYEAGADAIENDIQLSADGEIFILHDDSPARLLGITDVDLAEKLTLAELKAHPFLWDDPALGVLKRNAESAASSRYGTLIGADQENVVPTLREYIEVFKGTKVIHDTEIKSYDPNIIGVYEQLVDAYDAWDQFFTITFNTAILDALYADHPQISVGALFSEWTDPARAAGKDADAEEVLRLVCAQVDKWNATYNPHLSFDYRTASAGRHRGLTVWPWTYNDPETFARAYLSGIYGITTNWAWWAGDWVVEITSADLSAADVSDIPRPIGRTRTGAEKLLQDAEPIRLEGGPEEGGALMIWRWKTELTIDGVSFGSCYLYSEPFTVTFIK
ncbi:MAG: hypothetical protein IJR97_04450 [Clostridia bacterium]|nr:hypothetical protein [Clostridia bacterium]